MDNLALEKINQKFGYVRVSTADQNTERQRLLLLQNYPDIAFIFEDIGSGKSLDRIGFHEMEKYLRPGDTIVIESFSRISRNTKDLLNLIYSYQEKRIHLISIKENFDFTSPNGKLYLTVLSALVQFERELLLDRQREGIAIAKALGKFKGRKPIKRPDNFDSCYKSYINRQNNYKIKDFMRDTGLKKSILFKFINQIKLKPLENISNNHDPLNTSNSQTNNNL